MTKSDKIRLLETVSNQLNEILYAYDLGMSTRRKIKEVQTILKGLHESVVIPSR